MNEARNCPSKTVFPIGYTVCSLPHSRAEFYGHSGRIGLSFDLSLLLFSPEKKKKKKKKQIKNNNNLKPEYTTASVLIINKRCI